MALTAERSCLRKTHKQREMRRRKTIFLLHLWNVLILVSLPIAVIKVHPTAAAQEKPLISALSSRV